MPAIAENTKRFTETSTFVVRTFRSAVSAGLKACTTPLKTQRNEFRRVVLAPDSDHDVLLALVQIRHHRARRAGVECRLPQHFPGRLVKRPQLLAPTIRRRAHVDLIAFADEEQRLRRQRRRSDRLAERAEV